MPVERSFGVSPLLRQSTRRASVARMTSVIRTVDAASLFGNE
jgi:hypothetical protein